MILLGFVILKKKKTKASVSPNRRRGIAIDVVEGRRGGRPTLAVTPSPATHRAQIDFHLPNISPLILPTPPCAY